MIQLLRRVFESLLKQMFAKYITLFASSAGSECVSSHEKFLLGRDCPSSKDTMLQMQLVLHVNDA